MTSRVICMELDSTGEHRRSSRTRSTMELYTLNRACSSLLCNRLDKKSTSSLDAEMASRDPTNDSNRPAKAERKEKKKYKVQVSTPMGETPLDHHSTYRDRMPRSVSVPSWRSWLNNTPGTRQNRESSRSTSRATPRVVPRYGWNEFTYTEMVQRTAGTPAVNKSGHETADIIGVRFRNTLHYCGITHT